MTYEANSPAYWPQEAGAAAYAALLARCYDVLHTRPGPVNVISSTSSRHDPAGFVVVQDPETAESADMPSAAIAATRVDRILPLNRIGPFLVELCRSSG